MFLPKYRIRKSGKTWIVQKRTFFVWVMLKKPVKGWWERPDLICNGTLEHAIKVMETQKEHDLEILKQATRSFSKIQITTSQELLSVFKSYN